MAPMCPEEVDVFTVPHSRMKELVCQYLDMMTNTNFSDVSHLTALLENLIKTFREFIAHEQIENRFIMKKLKHKLRSLSIQNTAVCNCHKDNQLTDMLSLLHDGYKCTKKSDADRVNYGIQLRQALESFTETFLPHMAEEEQVFQPLLIEYFSTEELKQIKATVIQQHFKVEPDQPEKCVAEHNSCKPKCCSTTLNKTAEKADEDIKPGPVSQLPDEVMMKVFSNLNPRDLGNCAQVSRKWNRLAMDGSLWTELYPVSWAKGDWSARCGVYEEDSQDALSKLEAKALDEDADVDETDDWDIEAIEIQHQSTMLTSICKHLLPRVGRSVKKCDLAYSKGLTNGSLYKILSLCPNLEHLDLTQTRVSDLGFKGFKKEDCGKSLKHLDLSGCLYITDLTLQRISSAIGQAPGHVTQDLKCSSLIGGTQTNGTGADNKMNDIGDEKHSERVENHESLINVYVGACGERKEDENTCYGCEQESVDVKSNLGVSQTMMTHSVNVQKTSCIKCCGNELKSSSAGHASCQRTGPCQAPRACEKPCCDIESQGQDLNKSSFEGCSSCGRFAGQTKAESECCHATRYLDHQTTFQDEYLIPERSVGHGDRGQRSRTLLDDLDPSYVKKDSKTGHINETGASADWQGSTVENLAAIDEIANSFDAFMHDSEIATTQTYPDENLTKAYDEGTPADFNPSQTCLPDFILLPSSSAEKNDPEENDESSTDTRETLSTELGYEAENDVPDNNRKRSRHGRCLEFLSLSGCYQITDVGLSHLSDYGGLPFLTHLDLSGCWNLEGAGLHALVDSAPRLSPAHLYYCDNVLDGPYVEEASGCQNLQCATRLCCRCGE